MAKKILEVPFVKQKVDYCGPASLAMVLQYHGHNTSQDDIGDKLCAAWFAATTGQLEEYANEQGFQTELSESNLDELISCIEADQPVIVAQHRTVSDETVHFRVVVGYDSEKMRIFFHDPEVDAYLDVSYDLFSWVWGSKGFEFTDTSSEMTFPINVSLVLKK